MVRKCFCPNVDLHFGTYPTYPIQMQQRVHKGIPWGEHLTCAFTSSETAYTVFWRKLKDIEQFSAAKVAADYYLYEYIKHISGANKVPQELHVEYATEGLSPSPSFKVGHIATLHQLALEEQWAPILKEYLHYAIVSELCHSSTMALSFNTNKTNAALWGWGKLGELSSRAMLAEWATQIFLMPWHENFGGQKWLQIAKLLRYAETGEIDSAPFTDHLFLDRVFSMQHNSGTVFSKAGLSFSARYNLKTVLNAHGIGDMETVSFYASSEANMLYSQLRSYNE